MQIDLGASAASGVAGTDNLSSTNGFAPFETPYGNPGLVAIESCTGKCACWMGRNACEHTLVYPTS